MRAVFESRIDGAVPCGKLGIGETVEVRTLMGQAVARGEVYSSTPFGVTLRENGTNHKFYLGDFFVFIPEEAVLPEEPTNMLVDDDHPDARVRAKLRSVEEDGDQDGEEAAGNNAEPVDNKEKAPAEDPTPAAKGAVADDASSVDVEQLPDDIKKAVVTVQKLDGDQMNYVLAQVGQAMMSALRRSNVSEAELHGLVQKAQNSIYRILTGKPAREWKKTADK